MKTLSIIHISSNDCTYSSRDIYLHSFLDVRNKFCAYSSQEYVYEIGGEMYLVINIRFAPNFIKRCDWDSHKMILESEKLLETGLFRRDKPEFYEDFLKLYSLKYDIVREKSRKDEGFVMYLSYPKKHKTGDYVGGFTLDTFFIEKLIGYVESGLTFGYIGHSCRKVWVDKLLEKYCLKYILPDDFACWLTSTDGRHFGDYIECIVEDNDREGVEQYIIDNITFIHDKAVIYNHPEHKGSLKSAKELFEILKDMNMID